jgi:WW domain
MTGPATPGQEGPSFAPPPLPEGWIAQWDGVGRKYYFVQLSTGASQWELPMHPAPTIGTPTATPGQEISPFSRPGQNQEIGQRGVEEDQVRPDGERSLTVSPRASCLC